MFSLLNDKEIQELALQGMIEPFTPEMVRKMGDRKVFSFGLGSYGYDLRLSPKEFKIFRHIPGSVVDPKDFNQKHLENAELYHSDRGDYFIIPGNSYGLGVALERLSMPPDVMAVCAGKSSYARVGVIVNVTPAEAKWSGHLTLEFSNASPADVKIYCQEGVTQLLFLKGSPCETTYSDRNGKYQDQPEQVVLARV